MAYFAELDGNNVVQRVIVADQEFINSGLVGNPASWVETAHDGSVTKHYAGVGDTFDVNIGDFIHQKPYPSWELDAVTNEWKSPIDPSTNPDLKTWDEAQGNWVNKK